MTSAQDDIKQKFDELQEVHVAYAQGRCTDREKRIAELKVVFPKIGDILSRDLLEQKRINDEFGYLVSGEVI